MKILAVDDDPFIRELLPIVFREADYPHLTLADSGAAALALLDESSEPFDCLLLDIEMPQMDGITLCRKVRALEDYQNTPILMVTLRSDAASIERAFAAGANDYVTKPFDVKDIATRVHIAERMLENTEKAPRLDLARLPEDTPPGVHDFRLEDPLHIFGVPQLVLPFSLGNYLSQLSRQHLDICQVFATKIEGIEDIYANSTSSEYARTLAAAAASIAKVVDCPQLLMTHNGSGTILSIVTGDSLPGWPEIEGMIQDELDALDLRHNDGCSMPVTLSVGGPIQPNASRTQRVRKTFDRAIRRVASRQKVKPEATPLRRPSVSAAH
ncbi:PleD family two-component system response regulator [Sulfitobacter sp. PS-8MA]|uniref:PleD family two-component system response regulator n=1 Tax=Sulfitobacter sp. PS-8MA TaxID=3237707 RepID=UPI0034C5B3A9